jgi:hypothetical protein
MIGRPLALVAALACLAQGAQGQELVTLRYGQNAAGVGGLSSLRFVRAMASTYAFMNDPRNRDEVVAIVKETGKLSDDVARQIYASYLEPGRNVLPRRGELSLPALERVLGLMADVGAISKPIPPAERFVDLQYLKAAGVE